MSRAPMPDTVKGEAPMPSSFDDDLEFWNESRWSKLRRRLLEEPLIPVGLGLTCYALYQATRSIRRGTKTDTNRYFRMRVYAQGFTVLCLVAGSIYWKEDREKRKYYEGLLSEKRAQEKRDAWIRELEIRDEEDRLEREEKARQREARREMQRQAKQAEQGFEDASKPSNSSALSSSDVRDLVCGRGLLAQAWKLWHWRAEQDGQ